MSVFWITLLSRSRYRALMQKLAAIEQTQEKMMTILDDLKVNAERMQAAVERNTSVDESVQTLVMGMADQLRVIQQKLDDLISAGGSGGISVDDLQPISDALGASADKLEADNEKLAAAVVANTPVQPSNG